MRYVFNGPAMRAGAVVYLLVSETPERERQFRVHDELSADEFAALPAHTKRCVDGGEDSLVARGEVEKVTATRGRKSEGE